MFNKNHVIVLAVSVIAVIAVVVLAMQPTPSTPPATPTPATPPAPTPAPTPVPPPQPPTPQPAIAPVSATTKYQPGSIVSVHPFQSQGRGLGYKKGAAIGSFIITDNPWSLGLHKKNAGLALFQDKPLGYETDALFHAKKAGEYSFVASVTLPPAILFENPDKMKRKNSGWISCHYELQVGSQTVIDLTANTKKEGNKKELICGFTKFMTGSTKLAEGAHRLRQSFYCDGERMYKQNTQYVYPVDCKDAGKPINTDIFPGDEAEVTLMVRNPQESAPTPLEIGELFHEKQ